MGRGGQADCGTNCSGLLAGGGLEKGREVAVEFSGGGVQRRGGLPVVEASKFEAVR